MMSDGERRTLLDIKGNFQALVKVFCGLQKGELKQTTICLCSAMLIASKSCL
jgi:hypothetical protein